MDTITTRIERIPALFLDTSPGYQRSLDLQLVKKIASAIREEALGLVVVSERAGNTFTVIDGQHRVHAVREVDEERELLCEVHTGMTYQQEAELFVFLQKNRKPMKGIDRFRAEIEAGDERAIAIQKIIEEAGYHLPRTTTAGKGGVIAVSALVKVFTYDKTGDVLRQTMGLIARAWGEDIVPNGVLIEAIGTFLAKQPTATAKRLGKVLEQYSEARMTQLVRAESESTASSMTNGGGRLLTRLYNKGLRVDRIPEWVAIEARYTTSV